MQHSALLVDVYGGSANAALVCLHVFNDSQSDLPCMHWQYTPRGTSLDRHLLAQSLQLYGFFELPDIMQDSYMRSKVIVHATQ